MMCWTKRSSVALDLTGKFCWICWFSVPPKGGVGEHHVEPLGDVADVLFEGVPPPDGGGHDAVEHEVHEPQERRDRLLLLAEEGPALEGLVVCAGGGSGRPARTA
jgi:hypothetical protein